MRTHATQVGGSELLYITYSQKPERISVVRKSNHCAARIFIYCIVVPTSELYEGHLKSSFAVL